MDLSSVESTGGRHAWVFIGTQRSGPGTGISRAAFDATTGRLSPFALEAIEPDPSFLAAAPSGRHLYVSNAGTPGGVTALSIDPVTGALTRLNHSVSEGRGPSQLSLDEGGRFVLEANYGGGYVEVLAVTGDGRLGAQTALIRHEGRSVHPDRQTRAYPHCVRVDPSNRFALVADLGLDRVLVYRFDTGRGSLLLHDPPGTHVDPGSGPRHFVFHPNGLWLYLVEELACTLTTFDWDGAEGRLRVRRTVPTLPPEFTGTNTSAEVLIDRRGRFLYVSNRGHDSVAVFAVDPHSGDVTCIQRESSGGRTPRYMSFDLTGRWLFVANCDSDSLAIFRVSDDGRLSLAGPLASLQRPYGIAVVARLDERSS